MLDNNLPMEYIPYMEWKVLLDTDFKAWLLEQDPDVQATIPQAEQRYARHLERMEKSDGRNT